MLWSKFIWLFQVATFALLSGFMVPAWGASEENMECYIEDMLCIPIPPKRTDYNKNELLLLLKKDVPESLYQSLLAKYGLDELRETSLDSLGLDLRVADTKGQDPLELSKKINRIYEELEAATNNIYKLEGNAGLLNKELLNDEGYPKSLTGARRALQYSQGAGVLIGMVDGPIDIRHSSLRGRIEQVSLVDMKKDSVANLLHGTAVAGVIISNHALIGIAPEARLFSVAAFEQRGNSSFSSSSALVAQAIDLAIKKKVDILNLSFSGGHDPLVEKMVKKAISSEIIVVASCGNDGSDEPRYPAAISGVVAVTAVDHLKRSYEKANTGKYIDVAAPGVGVLTTGPGERYRLSSGTSIAAANVSGSLALLLAKYKKLDRDVLSYTATDLGAPGRDVSFGDGLINIFRALKSML
jgi:subtilisin family serine protease